VQIVVNGVLTNYLDINPKQKQTLIILHGWGSSSLNWVKLTSLLSTSTRYILLDLPGFGSTGPLPNEPNIPEYTDFVKAFADKLHLHRFILAGHSFGGQIALDFSVKYPEKLISTILIAPAAIRERSKSAQFKISFAKTIRPLFRILPRWVHDKFLAWYSPSDYSHSNEYQRQVLRKIVTYNLKSKLHLVKALTHVIWGSDDFIIPYMGKYLAEHIPHATLNVIYGTGHLIHLDKPGRLSEIINSIISHD